MNYFLKGLFLLILLASAALYYLFAPTYATRLLYSGETISISRDQNNIPTIIAPSHLSFFYAIGRVHAEDRLFQMTFKLLVTQGRLSEFLGEKPLPMDKFMRELNLHGWGKQAAQRLLRESPTEYANFKAYVDSINDYANSLPVLPFDFQLIRFGWQNWTVGDIFGLYKLLEWSQSVSLVDQYTRSLLLNNYTKEEIAKFLPNTQEDWAFKSTVTVEDKQIPEELTTQFLKGKIKSAQFQPQVLKKYVELGLFEFYKTVEGSNQWAISGQHTKSGQPILAHDPHLQNVMPSQWYQIQAIYSHNGVKHSLSGISTAGVPFIVGKTDYFAMGITTIYMDNQDLYRERIEGNKYFVNNKWVDLQIRQQKIKKKTTNGIKEETFIIRQTHRGPLLSYILCSIGSYEVQDNLSLQWTGFNDQYSPLVVATQLAELRGIEQVKRYLLQETEYLFNVNVAFITRDGHIGYQQLGRYPIRRNPQSSLYVKDGTTTEHDWLGFVPKEHRLQVIDPAIGYIVNSNNRISSNSYYNGMHQYTLFTARSDRLHQIISSQIAKGHKFDVEDMKKIVSDTVDVYCLQILPFITRSLPQSSSFFDDFDCNFVKSSHVAAIYEVFIYQLHHLIKPYKAEKMSFLSMHPNAQYIFNFIKEAQQSQTKTEKLRRAWSNMKENLSKHFKTNDTTLWKWGSYHKDVMHHLPFSSSPLSFLYDRTFEGYGNLHTVNVGKMNKVQLGNFQTSHRANYRAIYSFAEENYWIIDSGSSQKWFSKFYDDQWSKFKENQFLTLVDPTAQSSPSIQL